MRRWGYAVPLLLPFLLVLHVEQGGAWTWTPVAFVFGVLPLLDLGYAVAVAMGDGRTACFLATRAHDMKHILLFFALFPFAVVCDDAADRILGLWATDKAEAHVEISRDEDGYRGVIVWLKEPFYPDDDEHMAGEPKTDRENPEPALRERAIVGLEIMQGFRYAGDDRWIDGTIYDPENGETYKCRVRLTDKGTLKVRGYVGISLFGRTTEWTPVLASALE